MTGREQKELMARIQQLESANKLQAKTIADLVIENSKFKVSLMDMVEERIDTDRRVERLSSNVTTIFDRMQETLEVTNERFEEIENILEDEK